MARARARSCSSRRRSGPGRRSPCRCRGSLRTRWSTGCSAARCTCTARSRSSAGRRRSIRCSTPALVGFPLSAFGLATGLDVLQGLQALVMSLAAVPVYPLGALARVARLGAGRGCAGGRRAGPHLLGADDERSRSSTRCSCSRRGRGGGDRAADAADAGAAGRRGARGLRDAGAGDRAAAGRVQRRSGVDAVARSVVGGPAAAVAGGGGARRARAGLARLPARLRRRGRSAATR